MAHRTDIQLSLQIIESPSPDEIFDARTEGSVLNAALNIAGISVYYNVAVNMNKFIDALSLFMDRNANAPDALPILHLSMHGYREGVSLTDDFCLTWDSLRDLLLYVAKGKLLVCMSSCYGFSGCRMAMSEHPQLPFLALVGHDAEVNLDDAAIGYAAFYHQLFKGSTVPQAVEAMQKASGDSRFMYIEGPEARGIWKQRMADQARQQLQAYLKTLLANSGTIQRRPQGAANPGVAPDG
jgi:hypothetical protein